MDDDEGDGFTILTRDPEPTRASLNCRPDDSRTILRDGTGGGSVDVDADAVVAFFSSSSSADTDSDANRNPTVDDAIPDTNRLRWH